MTKPTGFSDLKPTELYRSAIEDFALPVDAEDKNKKSVLLAAFLEGGVEWKDYVAQHPEVAPDPEPEVEVAQNVITSDDIKAKPVEEEVVIRVKEDIPLSTNEKYLIKMTRDNLQFNVKGVKFTQEHPYALVSPDVADYLLTKEDGFRQATPSELREFYG